jgi:hypothetical protein
MVPPRSGSVQPRLRALVVPHVRLSSHVDIMSTVLKLARRAACVYLIYLILLGPFWALDGRGLVDNFPDGYREALWAPALPLLSLPVGRQLFEFYLDEWYSDGLTETTR